MPNGLAIDGKPHASLLGAGAPDVRSKPMSEPDAETLKVELRILQGPSHFIHCCTSDAVDTLKERVEPLTGVRREDQRLICKGKEMKSGERVVDHGQGPTMLVFLMPNSKAYPDTRNPFSAAAAQGLNAVDPQAVGMPMLTAKFVGGPTQVVPFLKDETVEALKARLASLPEAPADIDLWMVLAGGQQRDASTVLGSIPALSEVNNPTIGLVKKKLNPF